MADDQELLERWHAACLRATECDRWGQPLEAAKMYKDLAAHMSQVILADVTEFSSHQKKILQKMSLCMGMRGRQLENSNNVWSGISLGDLLKIESSLKNFQDLKTVKDLPISVPPIHHMMPSTSEASLSLDYEDDDDGIYEYRANGSLLPRPLPVDGQTMITIHIEKIGLKEALELIDPFITISVRDANGDHVTPPQDTPVANRKEENYIHFSRDVYIQRPLEVLPKGFAIFLEMNHYKPKKKSVSMRCWSCLEADEIKEGPTVIEVYKKPTDYKRKRLQLLTRKPLYLHLKISCS